MRILQDAWESAQALLDAEIRPLHGEEIVIVAVSDHPRAWAFSYNTREFAQCGDFRSSLVGNGPVVVPKSEDPVYLGSSARPIKDQLDQL